MPLGLTLPYTPDRLRRPELLDDSPASEAIHSLRDLRRINRYFGGHRILRGLLREQRLTRDSRFTWLEIGAGSGDNTAAVLRDYPRARAVLLDYRLNHVGAARGIGSAVVADAFQPPFAPESFDYVFCSLFLHHFSEAQIVSLLRNMRTIARCALIVTDLERRLPAYYTLPLTQWLFRWHPITLHDGPASVQAGFRRAELQELASAAGLPNARIRRHDPWFRLSLVS